MAVAHKLYHKHLMPGEDVSNNIKEMLNLFLQLEEQGMEFDQSHQCFMILSSLDDSWDNLVISLENMPEKDLTVQYLSGKLVEEDQR